MTEDTAVLRLMFFVGVFALIALWEALCPKRKRLLSRLRRWSRNLSLVILASLCVRFLVPFSAIAVAIYAQTNNIGVLHYFVLPEMISVVIALIMLDLAIYVQHVVFHFVPFLWRFHKIHHIDQEIDVTTGIRFHPVEIVMSILIKCTVILALGAPIKAVIIFEILLNTTAMFNHGNIALPSTLDRLLRLIVVTPDMHRVHHSTIIKEANRNFGFNLPWWDRLFGTYQAQPEKGHEKMSIGMADYRSVDKTGLWPILIIPFLNSQKNKFRVMDRSKD